MGLSSNSVFHFTSRIDTLKSIFKDGNLRVSYSQETYNLHKVYVSKAGIPMVSFCDIPLSHIKDHASKYGKYAIGLSKSWGRKVGLNPVLYVERDSNLAKNIEGAIFKNIVEDKHCNFLAQYTYKEEDGKIIIKEIKDEKRNSGVESSLALLSFMKNTKGSLIRKGKEKEENYKFYDEREWRYVPSYKQLKESPYSIPPLIYNDEYNESPSNNVLADVNIKFTAKDIDYIILKKKNQIPSFIDFLDKQKHLYLSEEDSHVLISKIYTYESIESDV